MITLNFKFLIIIVFFYRFGPHISNNIFQSPADNTKAGDLLFDGEWYFLNLGDELSRPEQGYTHHTITYSQKITSLCTPKTINYIHWMVNERFSSYNKVIPLFFGNDITLLLKHKTTISNSTKKNTAATQKLLLFPSILSIQHYINTHHNNNHIILSGSSTTVQKAKAYRSLSQNKEQELLCTHSQVFQNRNNLTEIQIMDHHSPYYHTFQEPRYTISTTIEKMKSIYIS